MMDVWQDRGQIIEGQIQLHASTIALNGRAMMFVGPSGSGKSRLTLELLAFGAELVADDKTIVTHRDGGLWAQAPDSLFGLVEARHMGLLAADAVKSAELVVAVDLSRLEDARLPQHRSIRLLGVDLPLLLKPGTGPVPAALLQYLKIAQR